MSGGAWAARKDAVPDYVTQVTIFDEADGHRVATVFDAEAVPVIAAAPAMLEALELIARRCDEAAIEFQGISGADRPDSEAVRFLFRQRDAARRAIAQAKGEA